MKATTANNQSRSWLTRGAQSVTLLSAACALLIGAATAQAQPTTVATTPTAPQGHVIALWNSTGVYTNAPVDNYNEVWYGSTPGTYTIPSTTNVVFTEIGMVCCAAFEMQNNPKNVSGCTNLHIDVYTPNGNNLTIRLVDSASGQADMNYTAAGGVITNNGWISLDIPLSTFTGVNLHSVKQLGWIDNGAGSSTPADYYFDNIYFSGSTNLVYVPPPPIPVPTNTAATPARPASSVLAMYNSSSIYPLWPGSAGVNWHAGWSGSAMLPFTITNTSSTVMNLPGLSYVGVEFYNPNQVDTTGFTTLHFDVWSLNGDQIGVQLVSLAPTVAAQVYSSISTTQQWVGIDIPLSRFSADKPAVVLSDLQQLLWVDNGGSGLQGRTFYVDNVYFWTTNQVKSSIASGKQVSWTASFADSYQPQKSANNTTWANLGGLLSGNAVTSVYDGSPVPYYRVLDISSTVANLLLNPSFETPAANNCGAADWTSGANTATETVMVTNSWGSLTPHSGTNLLYIEGTTPASGPVTPPNTYAYQNMIPVTPGVNYAVSFYAANPVKVGGGNPQYFVQFYDGVGTFISQNVPSFASAGSTWTKFSSTNTAPVGAAQMAVKFIQGLGAGNGWDWVTLVDDVSVTDASAAPVIATNVLSAVVQSGVGITWQSGVGLTYTVQSTPNLTSPAWSPLGANVVGTGTNTVSDTAISPENFYRVLEDY
jgi:hypothetical protein